MKEHFENRRLNGRVFVTCKFENGEVRYWDEDKKVVCVRIISIVERYQKMGLPMTLRQLHYQMVRNNWIVNHDSAYKKLGLVLDDLRYSGMIDWDAIEDRGRVPHLPYDADSVSDALDGLTKYYRRNRQENQDVVVELWTEKDALSGIFRIPGSKYHIQVVVNKGYTSSSAIYDAYQRITDAYDQGRHFIILYFGDHDPSGLDMIRDIRERLSLMLSEGDYSISEPEDVFTLKQIGLTMDQIKEFKLPPNPAKLTDSRAKDYIAKFGNVSWEVDALSPDQLIAIVEDFVENYIDMDKFEEKMKEEADDMVRLKKAVEKAKKDEDKRNK